MQPVKAAPEAPGREPYGLGCDSFLLLEAVLDRAMEGRRLLELCCGRGLLSIACAGIGASVTAVDRDPIATRWLQRRSEELDLGIEVLGGDLFSPVKGTFDLVACNPPYLPSVRLPGPGDPPGALALFGGRGGREVLDRVLAGLQGHLAPGKEARALLVVCCHNRPRAVVRDARRMGFRARTVRRWSAGPRERLRVIELRRV